MNAPGVWLHQRSVERDGGVHTNRRTAGATSDALRLSAAARRRVNYGHRVAREHLGTPRDWMPVAVIVCAVLALPGAPARAIATAPPATTPRPAAGPSVTITAVGDTMLGNTPQLPPNASHYLDAVRSDLTRNSQIAFMNLEGTLTSAGGGKCGGGNGGDCYEFRTPPRVSSVYKAAGFSVANSANNHYNDFGAQGQRDTTAALRRAGIVQTGRPGQIGYVKAGGVSVAFLGFAPYGWASNLLDFAAARAQIQRAKAHADQVVVYMHAGAEGAAATHVTDGA